MNIREKTTGNAYTRDSDYAAFTGRVVRTYTTAYYDPKLKAWIKRTVEYIDVGRPDAVEPVCEDLLLDEPLPEPVNEEERAAEEAAERRIRLAERDAWLLEQVKRFLADYGEASLNTIAQHVGVPRLVINSHLRKYPDIYVHLGGPRYLWGLQGVDYGLCADLPQYAHVFRAALLEHGPMTVAELCKRTGIQRGSATAGMARLTDIFVKVNSVYRKTTMAAVWGLVGVHDVQEATAD